MKILHVIWSLHTGGAERLVTDLAPIFNRDGCTTDVLLLDGTPTDFKRRLLDAGVRILEFSESGGARNPLHIFRLARLLGQYDAVHTHTTYPQLFAAAASMFSPSAVLVTTEHSTSNRRRGMRWYRFVDRWMYTRYRKIICISEPAASSLRRHLGCDLPTVCTVSNGIDTRAFAAARPDAEICRKYDGCTRLIMVARFAAAKDHATVIRAMKLLPSECHLFFVGDGPRRGECERMAKELQLEARVHFMGMRADVAQLLKSCHIGIMSSHWDGFGLAAVEAMAARLPVAASDVEGLREVVDGAGLLFGCGDASELASQVRRLIADPDFYDRTSEACFARACEYDISATARAYESIYKELILKNHA